MNGLNHTKSTDVLVNNNNQVSDINLVKFNKGISLSNTYDLKIRDFRVFESVFEESFISGWPKIKHYHYLIEKRKSSYFRKIIVIFSKLFSLKR
jgi:hypothetical protein